MKKKIRIEITLPEHKARMLKAIASLKGIQRTELIINLIEEFIEKQSIEDELKKVLKNNQEKN